MFCTSQVGDTLEFKGPLGEFDFDCSGVSLPRDTLSTFKKDGGPGGSFKHLGLIAGGSGITPCLQVAVAKYVYIYVYISDAQVMARMRRIGRICACACRWPRRCSSSTAT